MSRISTPELAVLAGATLQPILSRIHEVPTVKFLATYLVLNVVLIGYLVTARQELLQQVISANGLFTATLLGLTLIRRIFFHPLSRFPGHKAAAFSKLYEYWNVRRGRNIWKVLELHRQHGDFIRTGPNELSINNVEAVQAILGRRQCSTRGPFYALSALNRGVDSLITVRDTKIHSAWRRIWDKAFSGNKVVKYSTGAERHVRKMVEVLEGTGGREVDARDITNNMSFDIMADTSFGASAGMQDGTGDREYMPGMRRYLTVLSSHGSLRNLCDLVPYLPEPHNVSVFHAKGMSMVLERQKLGISRDDVWTQLFQEDEETGMKFSQNELLAAAQLVIVAGTDTTSAVLATAFHLLALHPEAQERLYRELKTLSASTLTTESVMPLEYLNAVINEALRLGTPVPSGIQMTTNSDGVTVAGTFVPGLTDVRVPHLALMTDDRYFPSGSEFIPERWTEKLELVRDKRAFIPFAFGAHACPGKALAMNELRMAVASVVKGFNIELGENYDEKVFVEGLRDNFTLHLGPLPLKFVRRSRV